MRNRNQNNLAVVWRLCLIGAPLVVLISLAISTQRALAHLYSDMASFDRSYEAYVSAFQALSALKDAETGQRGYVLTGDERYLEPYLSARSELVRTQEQLRRTTTPTEESERILQQIHALTTQEMKELAETIEMRRHQGLNPELVVIRTDRGKQIMDEIRRDITALKRAEELALARKTLSLKTSRGALGQLVSGGIICLMALLLAGTVVLERDMRQRRGMTQALRESEEHYRYSVNLSPQLPWTASESGNLFSLSEKWSVLTGLPPDANSSAHWINALHAKDRTRTAEAWVNSVATGEPFDVEHRLRLTDGNHVWMHSRAFPRRDDKGRILRWYGTSENIDSRKQIEIELREYREALERTVDERTQQLVEANRQLKSANDELNTFAYTASHDLRAPLRNLNNLGQILIEDFSSELSPPVTGYIQRMRAASQRMASLIDDLLAFSRLSREKLHKSTVNLSELANEIIEELRSAEPARSVSVIIQPGLNAWGSLRLLKIALENLLRNAWKYTGRSQEAKIEFGSIEDERIGKVTFFVRDNGVGFDMRHNNLLFAPFQRLHSERDFPGSGIGLATVQRVVRRHGGDIWANSEVGCGATFFFVLPSHREEVPENDGEALATASGG